jgi:integrase
MPRKRKSGQHTIARLGQHGRRVRVWRVAGTDKVSVQCRAEGITKSYRGQDAEAKAMGFAKRLVEGFGRELTPTPKLTVSDLWERYTSSSDYRQLRPRSQALYKEAWRLFTDVVPTDSDARAVNVATLETVRTAHEDGKRERTGRPYALNTIRKSISIVKGVFAWAERVELLEKDRVHQFRFKVAKDKRPVAPPEYTKEEFAKLLGALSFDKASQRYAHVVLACCGYQGARINAVLHLRWEDVDFDAAIEIDGKPVQTGLIIWRARFDKQGNEWDQPMRAPFRAILARLWESVDRPATGWVFPPRQANSASETYRVTSFWWTLRAAEVRAGVTLHPGRAAHGFRRMVAGDVAEATGSALSAMQAIGDRDIRLSDRYVKHRRGGVAKSLNSLDRKVVGE